MSSVVIAGDTSGSVSLSAPAVAGTTILTLPTISGTVATTTGTTTFTATQTFAGSSSALAAVFTNAAETTTISALTASGTINYDITTQSILYYTSSASGNFTINFRGSAGTSLNTLMSVGQTITAVFMCTNGATAYYNTAVQVDGIAVTPKWQGGSAPTTGNTSSVDVYTYSIVKTGAGAYTVFASQTRFA